jgi:hypothetical protein
MGPQTLNVANYSPFPYPMTFSVTCCGNTTSWVAAAGAADASQAQDAALGGLQGRHGQEARRQNARRRSSAVDKSLLTLPEPRRIRDRDHVRSVARQPCLICGRQPADAHHLRFAQSRALGRKVSDEFTIPLCRGHHRAVHRCGDEAAWWGELGIDPTAVARVLWLETHPLPAAQDQTPCHGYPGGWAYETSSK